MSFFAIEFEKENMVCSLYEKIGLVEKYKIVLISLFCIVPYSSMIGVWNDFYDAALGILLLLCYI